MMYEKGQQYEKAVSIHLQSEKEFFVVLKIPDKNYNLAGPMMDKVTAPKLHQQYGQAMEGQKKYAGTYKAASSIDSSVDLTIDDESELRIKSWISNGVDFLATYRKIKEPYWLLPSDELRLIPSNMDRGADTEVWRVQPSSKKEMNSERVFDDFCMPHLDYFMYFNQPADEFVFKSEDGIVKSIAITGLRVELFKML